MPFNVLLLPLLGGYIFISRCRLTRYDAARYNGERLLFHSAVAGTCLLVVAYLVASAAKSCGLTAPLPPAPFPYLWTSFLAFFLGVTAWWPVNGFVNRDAAVRTVINRHHNYLEILLDRSLTEQRLLSLTCESGKVYIGQVLTTYDPSYDRKYVKILPFLSGYRESESKTVRFTTNYTTILEEVRSGAYKGLKATDFEIVLPLHQIVTANIFDDRAYARFSTVSEENNSEPLGTAEPDEDDLAGVAM